MLNIALDKKEKLFIRLIRILPIIMMLFVLVPTTLYFFVDLNNNYNSEIKKLSQKYTLEKNDKIKESLDNVSNYILYQQSTSLKKLKNEIKDRTYIAHNIATRIYNIHKDDNSREVVIKKIKFALESFSHKEKEDYIFIIDSKGKSVLHPLYKDFEDKNLANLEDSQGYKFFNTIIKTIEEKTELYDEYYWYKDNDKTKFYKKIGFYKYFEAYDLAICTGAYVDTFIDNQKDEMLNFLKSIEFSKNESLFLIEENHILINKDGLEKKPEIFSKNINKNKKASFISFTEDNKDKTAYVKYFDNLDWIVGIEYSKEELFNNITLKKDELKEKRNEHIINILAIGLFLGAILFLISLYFTRLLEKRFLKFKYDLKKEEHEKNLELVHSAELYKDMFESNQSIILLINPDNGDIINANKSALDFYGYAKEKLLSMNIIDINTASMEEIKEEMGKAKELKRNYFNFIHKLKNGELRNVRVATSTVNYLNTTVLFSVIVDSTKEFEIRDELFHKEEEFKSFFELSINLQVITSIEGEVIQINDAVKDILGYEKEELLGSSFIELIHPDFIEITIEKMEKLSNGENVYFFENRCKHKNGDDIYLVWSATPDSTNNLIYATAQNITQSKLIELDKKEKEKLLIQQSKMATMGEMIGNIAHQWKQPLSLISMSNGLLKFNQEDKTFSTEEDINEAIENIDNSVEHLSTTIDDFRNFFIPDKQKVDFRLKTIYEKTYRLLSSQFKNNSVEIIVDLEDIEMYGYPNEILQVLINIIKNARDELVKNMESKRKLIFIDGYKYDDKILIKIKDNAGGIPLDIISEIFKSYFTTKEEQNGTGIGLYMSKQIIEGMNGVLEASNVNYEYENIEYTGAEFTIELKNNK